MGIRRARRARRRRVRLGRRACAERTADGEHLAWRLPMAEGRNAALPSHLAGDRVPAQWLRHLRHDRQRLGVDERLVLVSARGGRAESLLHSREPARRTGTRELRPLPAEHQDPAQSAQGRLTPVCAELLPPLSARGTSCAAGRHVDESSRLSLRREEQVAPVTAATAASEQVQHHAILLVRSIEPRDSFRAGPIDAIWPLQCPKPICRAQQLAALWGRGTECPPRGVKAMNSALSQITPSDRQSSSRETFDVKAQERQTPDLRVPSGVWLSLPIPRASKKRSRRD